MKIIIDTFGGDNGAEAAVYGVALAASKYKNLEFVLAGDTAKLMPEVQKYKELSNRYEILHAPDGITNEDVPTVAIRTKKESSLVRALDMLKSDSDASALVSAGSTGAILTGGLFKVGRIQGVSRPALCPIIPTLKGGVVALVDAGANVDCKPLHLVHFALMGTAYLKGGLNVNEPKVALLSNGTEDKKGNELNKEAFALLKAQPGINFIGNIEGRDLLSGNADIIVTDGFAGNICLKSYEGCAKAVFTMIKRETQSAFKAKIGALLLKAGLKRAAKAIDYNNIGGALILGLEKTVIKIHGSSQGEAFFAAIRQAADITRGGVVEGIKLRLETQARIDE